MAGNQHGTRRELHLLDGNQRAFGWQSDYQRARTPLAALRELHLLDDVRQVGAEVHPQGGGVVARQLFEREEEEAARAHVLHLRRVKGEGAREAR